ncbi:hypothetical protein [Nitrosomonas communis]|uniref:hypothetical protein n=1 Tax=Nitrosomonas communis TaxID=44574 RepID=UPI003D2C2B6F
MPKLLSACVIVMDNATVHKRQDIKITIANAGHTLEYLPRFIHKSKNSITFLLFIL